MRSTWRAVTGVRSSAPSAAVSARAAPTTHTGMASKPFREKYDPYLTPGLLAKAMATERLEAASVPKVARLALGPSN